MKNGITSIEIEEIENYLSYIRPSEEIRDQLDIGYRIEKQSVIILKLDRIGSILKKKTENKVAKATFVKKERSLESVLATCLKWHSINLNHSCWILFNSLRKMNMDAFGSSFNKPRSI
jgi:hypothetical protein